MSAAIVDVLWIDHVVAAFHAMLASTERMQCRVIALHTFGSATGGAFQAAGAGTAADLEATVAAADVGRLSANA